MLLESLLQYEPKRTVAYYNLADSYWKVGRKKEAKQMYETYVKQMRAKGKEKRIPHIIFRKIER